MTFDGDTEGTVWGQCGLDSINKLLGALVARPGRLPGTNGPLETHWLGPLRSPGG
jgi:hypothetical protein